MKYFQLVFQTLMYVWQLYEGTLKKSTKRYEYVNLFI